MSSETNFDQYIEESEKILGSIGSLDKDSKMKLALHFLLMDKDRELKVALTQIHHENEIKMNKAYYLGMLSIHTLRY